MALTDIGFQKTPGRPIELTFGAELGLPNPDQNLVLIGHAASGATGINTVITINNVADPVAASGEVATKFGDGSELSKMVLAAVNALAGGSTFPTMKCIPLVSTDTGFGSGAALSALNKIEAEFVVSPYDGTDATNRNLLKNQILLMNGPQRVENSQFGSFGVIFNRNVTDPSLLPAFDTPAMIGCWLRDTGSADKAPAYSIAESAAAAAAILAANSVPFNPLDAANIPFMAAPAQTSDWPTVGAGLESETCLKQGWTPLYVKPAGDVAFVRTVTGRITTGDGVTPVTAYYDVQDFSVLYFWRKTQFVRFNQDDWKRRKASNASAQDYLGELIRLATLFQDQNMFQAVDQLAKMFKVERNVSDRHRFDSLTPVNVIPGLHVLANNTVAGTLFDVVTL